MRVLKIDSLPSQKEIGWIDRDHIMLHACFQLLEDCVNKEKVDTHCDYKAHKKQIDEVRALYNWWVIRKLNNDFDDDDQDDKMLIRLMKIRTFLWT